MSVPIVSRSEWGARPPKSRNFIELPSEELWLHHSAGALDAGGNGVWWDDVRGIQDFHMRPVSEGGRGWSDIAYSFLIGGGQVFEGRGVGIAGGHTKGRNTVSHAICVVGNYELMTPQPEDVRAVADLVRHGREQGWWGDLTGDHSAAPGAQTSCCGRNLRAAIPEIRALAGASRPQEDDMTPEQAKTLDATMLYAKAALQVGERLTKAVAKLDADLPDNLEAEVDEIRKNLRRDLEAAGVPEDEIER